jgi:hypothetical protein
MNTHTRNGNPKRIAISVLLLVLLVNVSGIVARADEAPQPHVLTGEAEIGSALPGDEAGLFAYYKVNYPGRKADLRIQVTFGSYDPSYNARLGFNVYGPGDFEGRGVEKEGGTFLEFSYREDAPAPLLVQVYNYTDATVYYSIVARGLAADLGPTGGRSPSSTPTPTVVGELGSSVSGLIVGSRAGAYGLYVLQYACDEEDVTVTMKLWPEDPSFAGAFGFQIYDPEGQHVATGVANDALGVRKATFASDWTGEYVVQVYNYSDGAPLHYTLAVAR